MDNFFKTVLTARVYDVARRTPLDEAVNLSRELGNQVFLKREDLQPSFSFKVRGAYNRMVTLSEAEREPGVICASAGNHAQGVALAAQRLEIAATVVMPRTTPAIKVEAVQRLGAQVILEGDSYSDAAEFCEKLAKETGKTFVHAFDDAQVIAGQGTVGHELLQQCPEVDMVFVPVGGGGLIAGIAAFIKAVRPKTKIVGVQPQDSDAMTRSLQSGKREKLAEVGIFADGVAVKRVGALTLKLAKAFVDEMVIVTTDETSSAIKTIYEDTRAIVEPAGALAVAGLRKYVASHPMRGQKLVAINSGANMNFGRLQFVAERTLTGDKKEALFAVTIPETPGALAVFCRKVMAKRNITEFNDRLSDRRKAQIFVGVSIEKEKDRRAFQKKLAEQGFAATDLTDNELAKTHVRHMVGGRSPELEGEVLYRFEFPERPKALTDFLAAMSENWNISLFHYRMHGGDFGRVLVGFEIPATDKKEFRAFLTKIRYPFVEETGNPAYRLFL